MDDLISSFEREEYWWTKEIPCAFWGGEPVHIHIDVEDWEPSPTSSQVAILDAMLKRQNDFRPEFEAELFDRYKKEIYGYATYYSPERGEYGKDEITPPLSESSEIWSLIDDPEVWIKFVADDDWDKHIRFILGFECHWDEEHGLRIEVTDWKITSFHADWLCFILIPSERTLMERVTQEEFPAPT